MSGACGLKSLSSQREETLGKEEGYKIIWKKSENWHDTTFAKPWKKRSKNLGKAMKYVETRGSNPLRSMMI